MNDDVNETADFTYKKITVPTLDIESMKSGSAIMGDMDEKSPRPNGEETMGKTVKSRG